jgi:hypothetical protein
MRNHVRAVAVGLVIGLAGFALGLTTISDGATSSTKSVSLSAGQSVTVTCSGGTLQGTWASPLVARCVANTTTTTAPPPTTTTTQAPPPTTTTTTTLPPPGGAPQFVQADDTGTFDGNTTSIGSGESHQVLAHDTGIGHTVVLVIQTLTYPGTQTDTVTSVTSAMGTFQFVNSYNDGADNEIWVCQDTTGAADTITVTTPTNAWDALAVEFNEPATGIVNDGGQVFDSPYLGDQSWTVSPGAAGNVAFVAVDTDDAYVTGPAAPWTFYDAGYWSFVNGTSAAWAVAPSSAPLTATWETDGGESSSQAVVLAY